MIYTFHRASGWYPLELSSDEEAVRNALCNPGTEKVVNEISGETVWTDAQIRDQNQTCIYCHLYECECSDMDVLPNIGDQ